VARRGYGVADTTFTLSAADDVMNFMWRVNLRALAELSIPAPASLTGVVTMRSAGTPLAAADVWFPALDRHATTDASGAFRLDSLPPGRTLVQVRHLGFAAVRDTVTLAAGAHITRDFALLSQATLLDTVRTVAQGSFISPALRGFEDRRANHAAGYFIADSALRRYDNAALASIIASRVSGLMTVPGRSGATFLVSTRKQCAGSVMSVCSSPNCFVTTYLDGVLIYSAASAGSGPPLDASRMAVSELAGVEFYPTSATAPPQYNATDSGCGVLLLWTRER
jgi:hypothetical protein